MAGPHLPLLQLFDADTWSRARAVLAAHPELLDDRIKYFLLVLKDGFKEQDPRASLVVEQRLQAMERPAWPLRPGGRRLRQWEEGQYQQLALWLDALGGIYRRQERFGDAELAYLLALELWRRSAGGQDERYAVTLCNLGLLYGRMGRYEEAESSAVQAYEIWQRSPPVESGEETAALTISLAGIYRVLDRYDDAERLYRQSVEWAQATLGVEHPTTALYLNNFAALQYNLGHLADAERIYSQALGIQHRILGPDHLEVATTSNNLALVYVDMQRLDDAEALLERALAIRRRALGNQHLDVAQTLHNLAHVISSRQTRFAEAAPLYQQAIWIRRRSFPNGHPDLAESLNYLGTAYVSMGYLGEAEPAYLEALEILRAAFGEAHSSVYRVLGNLASLYLLTGRHAEAEPILQQALAGTRRGLGQNHPTVATYLFQLALLRAATDRESEAVELMLEADLVMDRIIWGIVPVSSERQRIEYLTTIRDYVDAFLSLVCLLPQRLETTGQAFGLALRRKAIGAEVVAAQRDTVLGGANPGLVPSLREVTRLRMQLATETLAGPDSEGAEPHERRVAELAARLEGLEIELARQIPELDLAHRLRTVDIPAVAEALPEAAVLVEFFRFDVLDFEAVRTVGEQRWKPAHYLAFTVVAGEPDTIETVDLGEAQPIDDLIAGFSSSTGGVDRSFVLDDGSSGSQVLGAALRALVFDPLRAVLGDRTRLVIAPDGALSQLPFEALPTGDNRYLIDDFRITYVASGRDVLRFGEAGSGESTPPLVMADPDFDLTEEDRSAATYAMSRSTSRLPDTDRGSLRFGPLPGTREEAREVAARLGVTPLLGAAASESLLKAAHSPRILHLATHGFFLPGPSGDAHVGRLAHGLANPLLRSGLALAGANSWLRGSAPRQAEDGILTAEDAAGLDLLSTDLVVLSACQTGLGDIQVGEGVLGLRRSFVLAGAKTVMMTLWKVPDEETCDLMVEVYRRLAEGMARSDALREAQLTMKARRPDPLYWGAFICQGDPGPLDAGSSSSLSG